MNAHALPPEQTQGHGFEGRVLGGFRMVREIACGGMATVYMAHKSGPAGFNQAAAVKVIHPHLARERDFVDMFLDEARIVSCINHPNVCRVLDFGKAEGTYYLAMEYVMGETWGDVLATMKSKPEAQAMIPAVMAQVLAQACEGLHAAHDARDPEGKPLSIVHRDISPQNLIVGYDGSVRVLDFGIASAAERLHTTRNGTIKGRFAYMAPEQMRGHAIDRRADVWSLGVVLWEGLAQKRLFKRETEAETVLAVTQDPLPSLQEVGHPVPAPLARIAQQALARHCDQRYTSAREMGLELSRFAGSSLVPVGMAEVSLWMQRLFADRISQKRELLREAARGGEPSRPPANAASARALELDISTVIDSAPPRITSSTLPSVSMVREVHREDPTPAQSDRPQRRLLLGPLLGAAAFGLLVGVVGMLAPRAAQPDESVRPVVPAGVAAARAATQVAPQPAPAATVTDLPSTPAKEAPARAKPSVDTKKPAARFATPAPVKHKAEPTERGAVNIATPGGWADVYIGGKKLGTTPGRFELPVGTHTLKLRPFGKMPELTRKVEVVSDGAQKLKIPLE